MSTIKTVLILTAWALLTACGSGGNSSANSSASTSSFSSASSISSVGNTVNQFSIQENNTAVCLASAVVENEHEGFTGAGYINAANELGSTLRWQMAAQANTSVDFTWRFANGGGANRSASVVLNGVEATAAEFLTTGAWAQWSTVTVSLDLQTGVNTLDLVSLGIEGLANIDLLTVAASDVVPVPCDQVIVVPEPTNFPKATAFLIGDSTVSTYNSGYYPQEGWGQRFQHFFNANKIVVDNRALGGRSSKSFYNDHWADVKNDIRAGDFVFIQFGINDRNNTDPQRYAPTGDGTFQNYMTRFARETQALGATPIFVATLVRNAWNGSKVYEAYHEHPVVTRELAASLNIPLVDLDGKSTALLESVGEEYATYFYYLNLAAGEYPNFPSGRADNVHFQSAGAVEMARLVAEGVSELRAFDAAKPLIAALNPNYALVVKYNPNFGLATKGFSYPVGTPLTLKVRGNGSGQFNGWYGEGQQNFSNQSIYRVNSAARATQYSAVFNSQFP